METDESSWKLIVTKEEIIQGVEYCADVLNKKYENCQQRVVIMPILTGAMWFHVDLTRCLKFKNESYPICASSYGNNQKQGESVTVKSHFSPTQFNNTKIILLDELFDTGDTLNFIKNILITEANVSANDIFTCTLLKKNKPTSTSPDLYAFITPDVWLIGYGLDYKGTHRHLPYVMATMKDDNIEKSNDDLLFENPIYYEFTRNQIHKQLSIYAKLNHANF